MSKRMERAEEATLVTTVKQKVMLFSFDLLFRNMFLVWMNQSFCDAVIGSACQTAASATASSTWLGELVAWCSGADGAASFLSSSRMTGFDFLALRMPSRRFWYSLCAALCRSEISAQIGQIFSLRARKGHILGSAFSMMAEQMPTPSLETATGWGDMASQKWRRKEKVIRELLTRQMLVQLKSCWEEWACWCLELRQGGLSQRWDILRERKRCVWFCPHLATGSTVLSLCTTSACSCFSRATSPSSTPTSAPSCCSSYSSRMDFARPTCPRSRLTRRQLATLISVFRISRASNNSLLYPCSVAHPSTALTNNTIPSTANRALLSLASEQTIPTCEILYVFYIRHQGQASQDRWTDMNSIWLNGMVMIIR